MNQSNDRNWFDLQPAFPLMSPVKAKEENASCQCDQCNCGDACVFEDVPGPTFAVFLAGNLSFHLATSAGNKALSWL